MATRVQMAESLLRIADFITYNERKFVEEFYYPDEELREYVAWLLKTRSFILRLESAEVKKELG